MTFEATLLDQTPYINFPNGWLAWAGWLLLMGVSVFILLRLQSRRPSVNAPRKSSEARRSVQWSILAILFFLVPLTTLFLVLRLQATEALPLPGQPVDLVGPTLIVFSLVPLVLTAGLLQPWGAMVIGTLTGVVLALWDSHHLFSVAEYALLALLFWAAFHQRYRTWEFRLLRQPVSASLIFAIGFPIILSYESLLITSGPLPIRLEYTLTHLPYEWLALSSEILLAGLVGMLVAVASPKAWYTPGKLEPSPIERRLPNRFLYNLTPLAILLILALIIGDWIVAGNAAQRMLINRMATAAELSAQSVPFFMETGQNLIRQIAEDPLWVTASPQTRLDLIHQKLRAVPFFREIYLVALSDQKRETLAGSPYEDYTRSVPTAEEIMGITLAYAGVPIQTYTVAPIENLTTARISFMAAVPNPNDGSIFAVIIGRTDLASNPFTQPLLSGLDSLAGSDGEGILLDSEGRIIYSSRGMNLMESYPDEIDREPQSFEAKGLDGTRSLVYTQPVLGHPWSVILSIPARQARQLALEIATPLLVILLALFFVAAVLLRWGLDVVTRSLNNLAQEANRIAGGQLDHPLAENGEDEVGQLRRSFEKMRLSLKARLDEINRLLVVSQGVAASLEMEDAVKPVLESALSNGASSARIKLAASAMPETVFSSTETDSPYPTYYGLGPAYRRYSYLDEQILELARQQERVTVPNFNRSRLFQPGPSRVTTAGMSRPEALCAVALRHENTFYGVLWIAYEQPHNFSEDETRFLTMLADQAALAAANARLFLSAEIGRQRLASILASTPDPVLVTDYQNRLLLSNPAAWPVLGLTAEAGEGQPIEQVIQSPELVQVLRSGGQHEPSVEVIGADQKVYLATASTVLAGGRQMGRVCVLRDVTHFKELDALKSEFVSTVSHDLRSPLTLMRGYATMLEMVGELNEQQNNYVRKIMTSIETMSRLVSNLLDLGRIEAGVGLQLEITLVDDIVKKVMDDLQLQANQKHIQLSSQMPENALPPIQADAGLLRQAFQNLVENAIKYTDPGGKVQVRVQIQEEQLIFSVQDTGIGIAPVDQARLFEKFFRAAQRDAKKRPGSGLGLAIVKSITERHGGKVGVESQLGKGSVFWLSIPLQYSAVVQLSQGESSRREMNKNGLDR